MLKKITILATTDIHSNIWGYNYEDNEEMPRCGMANLYTYIKQVRDDNPNTILVDNGDIIQGTLLSDDVYNKGWEIEHPVATAMNFMRYDAMNLGNHEFNFHLKVIDKFKKELKFPVLSANTVYKDERKEFAKPYTIIEKNGIKVGVIGLITPMVPQWVGNKVEELNFLPLVETTQKYILELKDKVDIFLVMAHCSLEGEINPAIDAARNLIEACPEIHGLVVGHFHITMKDEINNVVIGSATDKGREIIHFDFYLNENNQVVKKEVKIVDMMSFNPSSEMRELPRVKEAHLKTINVAHGKVLGQVLKDFQPENEINWIPQGRLEETPVIQLINKVQLLYSKADVSSTSLIKENSNLLKGNITYGNIYNIYKFDTQLFVVEITGEELKRYMEWNASAYNQLKEGDVSISFSADIPSYQHDLFAGVSYSIDLRKSIGERVIDLKLKGKTVKNSDKIKLAVSDYCYYTTLIGKGIINSKPIWKSDNLIKEMLVEYVEQVKQLKPELNGNWNIIGIDYNNPKRKELIKKVNEGKLDIPYNKSLNALECNEIK